MIQLGKKKSIQQPLKIFFSSIYTAKRKTKLTFFQPDEKSNKNVNPNCYECLTTNTNLFSMFLTIFNSQIFKSKKQFSIFHKFSQKPKQPAKISFRFAERIHTRPTNVSI